MAFPPEFLREVGERNRIEDVAASYVNLRRRGKNLVGLCPFHNEKTPSFCIYPENNSFFCFGCNKGGDVISFVMGVENLDFAEGGEVPGPAGGHGFARGRRGPVHVPAAHPHPGNQPGIGPVLLQCALHTRGQGRGGVLPPPGPGRQNRPALWPWAIPQRAATP